VGDLFWLSDDQLRRLEPFFPKSRGRARVDDRRVLSGIIFVNRNGLRWRDAPAVYGPPKTLYNRWVRRSRMGVWARALAELPAEGQDAGTLMIDATHLKAHRTAASLRGQKGRRRRARTPPRPLQGRADLQAARRGRRQGSADRHVPERRSQERLGVWGAVERRM
jgi:transposase